MIPLLRDPESEVRKRAALELARIDLGHEKKITPILFLPTLEPLLKHESPVGF